MQRFTKTSAFVAGDDLVPAGSVTGGAVRARRAKAVPFVASVSVNDAASIFTWACNVQSTVQSTEEFEHVRRKERLREGGKGKERTGKARKGKARQGKESKEETFKMSLKKQHMNKERVSKATHQFWGTDRSSAILRGKASHEEPAGRVVALKANLFN